MDMCVERRSCLWSSMRGVSTLRSFLNLNNSNMPVPLSRVAPSIGYLRIQFPMLASSRRREEITDWRFALQHSTYEKVQRVFFPDFVSPLNLKAFRAMVALG